MYNWIPNVETCVNEAYDFFVTNSKSHLFDLHERGNKNKIENFIRELPNKYYSWDIQVGKRNPTSSIGDEGGMQNMYYKVFLDSSEQITVYEIKRLDFVINEEKIKILIIGGIPLTLIFIG